jgi:hypothetical protein
MKRFLGAAAAVFASISAVGSASAQYVQHYTPYYQPRVVYVQHTSPFVYILEFLVAAIIIAFLVRVLVSIVGGIFSGPSRRYGGGYSGSSGVQGGSPRTQAYNQLARLQTNFNEMVNRNYGVTIQSIFYGPEVPFQYTPYFNTATQQLAQARSLFNSGNFSGALTALSALEATLIEADRYMYWSTFNSPVFLANPYCVSYASALGFTIGMDFMLYNAFLADRYIWAGDSFLFYPPAYDVVMAPGFDFVEVVQPDYMVPDSYVVGDIPAPAAEIIDAGPAGAFDQNVAIDDGGWGNTSDGAVIDDGFQQQQPDNGSDWANNSGGAVIEDAPVFGGNDDGGWGNGGGDGGWGGGGDSD